MGNDPNAAVGDLEKAVSLRPKDPKTLTVLAFAQHGAHRYADVLQTVERIHAMDHRGDAEAHYIAAAAAGAVGNLATMKSQLQMFVDEDPANPLAPVARKHLDALATRNAQPNSSHSAGPISAGSIWSIYTFPNSERLRSELASVDGTDSIGCLGCSPLANPPAPTPVRHELPSQTNALFTIHRAVDETALFLAVSRHGHMVNDLAVSDIRILDDHKAPDKILQFIPQSQLPLHLGLLIDISGSVQHRFQFEQNAAARFIDRVLNGPADLAFVAGFSNQVLVTQDFTRDASALQKGIQELKAGADGTSLFDAIDFSCRKLAAYPDEGRVAKVLVVLTDGEDNSSRRSLKQSIESADAAGVTVYTVNTTGLPAGLDTDANKVLQMVAQRSGGESVFPTTLRDLERYLNHLPDVIRSRYLIAYKPAGFLPNGKYRAIRVNAVKDGKNLRVHTRKGYYARLEAQ
ncbi:MAG TPA: VWA domain-containing protein [Candidatus Sulfotelmatobacter sp.]|nr:VWA domain-containing protein [Candidatus Sulfotelmatobacter sp.]